MATTDEGPDQEEPPRDDRGAGDGPQSDEGTGDGGSTGGSLVESSALRDEIGRNAGGTQEDSGTWRVDCPRCSALHSVWVMKSGFGCSACNWQSSNLNDFLGDGTGEQPTDHEAPPFVEVLGYELDELNAAKLAPIDVAPTPYPAWNAVCRDEGGGVGVARGWHVLIAGNTGMGKSLLAINVAAHAIRNGEKVGIISLEMSKAQLITRYMSIFSGEKIRRLEWGQAYREDVAANAKAMLEENYERNGGVLLTNKRPISKLSDIISAMRALHETRGCRYFVTDYLQLAWAGSAQNIHDRITEVSHSIRKEAVDLKVVSIGVSQFNRATSGSNERPIVQGMMGGSALENDSNQVLLLDHSTYEDYGDNGALIKLLVAKNRHGSSGEIPLAWDYSTLRAQEVDPREFEEGAKV